MSDQLNFDGPYLKVERAEHHMNELQNIFAKHHRTNKAAAAPTFNRMPRTSTTIGSKLPKHTSTILGDALHNLRAALDHAYCIMVLANGDVVTRHVKFPFHPQRQDAEGSVKGHTKSANAPSEDVVRFIFDVKQPFQEGKGEDLLRLHNLDIADKHMILLPTKHRTHIANLKFHGGVTITNSSFNASGNVPAFVTDRDIEAHPNNMATTEIQFGEGQPFTGQPVLPTLCHIRDKVVESLRGLERFLENSASH